MKQKIFCLLLASDVMMSVVPLTAFADDTPTVPEEYWGTYKGVTEINGEDCDVYITITKNEATLSIPDYYFDASFSLREKAVNESIIYWWFLDDDSGTFNICFEKENASLDTTCFVQRTFGIDFLRKVSDSTDSTLYTGSILSTASNWIIPVVAGVLALGVIIYIGKRKRPKDND